VEPNEIYTIQQVADFLKVSYGLIYKFVRDKKVESFKLGNQHRIKGSSVMSLMESSTLDK
jgi:excisionase family DNA binding protein